MLVFPTTWRSRFRPTTSSRSGHTGPFLWTRPNVIVAGVSRLSPFATPTFLFPVTIPSFFLLRVTLLYASHVGVIVQEATLPFAVSVLLGYNTCTYTLSLSLSLFFSLIVALVRERRRDRKKRFALELAAGLIDTLARRRVVVVFTIAFSSNRFKKRKKGKKKKKHPTPDRT